MAPLQILIVDENPHVRSGIRMLLQKRQDWTICGEARDGIEAIQKPGELKPEVILLDIFHAEYGRPDGAAAASGEVARVPNDRAHPARIGRHRARRLQRGRERIHHEVFDERTPPSPRSTPAQ